MTIPVKDLLISHKSKIKDALVVIERNGLGTAFVVNSRGSLRGIITDGDLRRALLGGAQIGDPVSMAMTRNYVSLPITASDEMISKHLNSRVHVLPLIDKDGRPRDYATHYRNHRLPVAEPSLSGNELNYVMECIKTNWISSQGAFVRRFETDFNRYVDAKNSIAVSNGTAALHLALAALGLGPGDEVILPDLTFAASINAILYVGATPVLADVKQDTWTIDPDKVAELITSRTKAIMPVHLYGQPADMSAIMDLAEKHGLYVVEDAAQALGSLYYGQHVGTFSDAGTFSFFGNKLITTGEGGMVIFRDSAVAARARRLRDHGMDPNRRYWHTEIGFNYRLTNVQAAIGVAQLEQIEKFIKCKLQIAQSYRDSLGLLKELEFPKDREGIRNVYWLFSIICNPRYLNLNRDELLARLLANGIEARPLFYPLHIMPPYSQFGKGRSFPCSDRLAANGFSLPSAVNLTQNEITHVTSTLEGIIRCRTILDYVNAGQNRCAVGGF